MNSIYLGNNLLSSNGMQGGGDSVTMKNYDIDWYDYDNSKDFLTALTVEQSCNQYPVNGSKVLRLSIPANYIIRFASTADSTSADEYSSYTPDIKSRIIKGVFDIQFELTTDNKSKLHILNCMSTDSDFFIYHTMQGKTFTSNLYNLIDQFINSNTNQTVCAGYKPFINRVLLYSR